MQCKDKKILILGAGQLGKMLAQAANALDCDLTVMDQAVSYPAVAWAPHFYQGDFTDYDAVLQAGMAADVISIEIESVNTQALHALVAAGKQVYPQPSVIECIQDKGKQKQFYAAHAIPTAAFKLYAEAEHILQALLDGEINYPFVQKARTGGYDGRGVQIISDQSMLDQLIDAPSVIEDKLNFKKELALIVARDQDGNTASYPLVEMVFDSKANLLSHLIAPSTESAEIHTAAAELATKVAAELEIVGLLAVELFLDHEGELWVNECAPRPHNSGHHTIEANICSQYEQLLRILLHLPLGSCTARSTAAMVNILGPQTYEGPARLQGLDALYKIPDTHLHWYGKAVSKPNRKMGHITLLDDDLQQLNEKISFVQREVHIRSSLTL